MDDRITEIADLIHRALALGPVRRPEPGTTPGIEARQISTLHHALVEGLWLALHPDQVTEPERPRYDRCRADAPGATTLWTEEVQPTSVYNWHRPESISRRVTERPRLLDHIRLVLAALTAGQEPGPLYDSLLARLNAYIDRERRISLPGVTIPARAGDHGLMPASCAACGSHGTVHPYRQSTGYFSALYAVCHECGQTARVEQAA